MRPRSREESLVMQYMMLYVPMTLTRLSKLQTLLSKVPKQKRRMRQRRQESMKAAGLTQRMMAPVVILVKKKRLYLTSMPGWH